MSVRARTTCTAHTTGTVRTGRIARAGVGTAGLALALTLSGCVALSSGPEPEMSETTAATAPASGTVAPTSGAPLTVAPPSSPGTSVTDSTVVPIAAHAGLPAARLERTAHEGEPRRLQDIFHMACLHVLDGEDLPEREGGELMEGQKPVWRVQSTESLTEGWKTCPTQMYEQIAVPAAFRVEAEPGEWGVDRLRIYDATGELIGGFANDVTASVSEDTELVEVYQISELEEHPAADGEARYLRTLLVDAGSGPQVLIDQVSAPPGVDPASLEVWDLAAGGHRDLVYAHIRLDTLEQGAETAESHLVAVLRTMVGSFNPSVQ